MTSPLSWRIAGAVSNRAAIYVSSGSSLLDGSESDGTNKLNAPSQDFGANWTALNTTLTANSIVAPDTTTTAAQLLETAVTDRHILYTISSFAITGGASVTYSVYAKMITRRYLQITVANTAKVYAYYDLQAGTMTGSGTVSPDGSTAISATNCQAAVNGFYKCSITAVLDAATTAPYFQFSLSDVATYGAPLSSDSPSYLGVITNGAALWRPKVV